MSFYVIFINTLSALFGALLIVYFLKSIYNIKITLLNASVFTTVFSLLNGYISSLMTTIPLKPVFLIILSIFFIFFLLKTSFVQAFWSFSLYTIGVAVGTSLVPVFMSLFIDKFSINMMHEDPLLQVLGNLLSNLTAFALFILIRPLKRYYKIMSKNKYLIILTLVTIFVICSSFALYYYMNVFDMAAYIIVACIAISYCIFVISVWFISLKEVFSREELAQQKFYNEALRDTLFDLRRFKHDWSNNLTVIHSMLRMSKISELNQYVSELITQSAGQNNMEIYNIKNAGLFGIISSKLNQAGKSGIIADVSVTGEVENIPEIKVSELCEIVGIIMDNAIEDCSSTKKIHINVHNRNESMVISISNSCTNAPDMQMIYEEGYSTKGLNRGMGLAIVKRIIDRHKNILLMTSYENQIFTQTIEIIKRKGF